MKLDWISRKVGGGDLTKNPFWWGGTCMDNFWNHTLEKLNYE